MNDERLLRYSRQIMLPELDVAGQEALGRATALVAGLGGLGSPAALYLAAAGLGRLILADDDRVEVSNLQRQIAHTQAALGSVKAESAAVSVRALNPDLIAQPETARLTAASLPELLEGVKVVLDGTDNLASRLAINDACWRARVPLVSGAAIRWEGQISVFDSRDPASPCYRCFSGDAESEALNCAENGVIAPLVGVIGAFQALEAIKLITGVGSSLAGRVLYFDGKRGDWQSFRLTRRPGCQTCDAQQPRIG